MDAEGFLTPKALIESLKKDKPQVYSDNDPWEKQNADSTEAQRFILGMRSISFSPALALSKLPLWKDKKVMLDVGGGSGVHLTKVLSEWKSMRGIFFDLPSAHLVITQTARPYFEANNVMDRLNLVQGDMFKDPTLPTHTSTGDKVDVILFSQIFHDWPIERGEELLEKAFAALDNDGTVVLHEKLLDDDRSGPWATAMVSIDMLFWTEGQQYTGKKLREMLTAAGFVKAETIKTQGYWSNLPSV